MTATAPDLAPSGVAGDAPDADPRAPLSWPARALALGGWLVVALGVLGATGRISHFAGDVPWRDLGEWFVYTALFHDLLIAPVVTLVALGVRRLPGLVRGPIAGGLIVSGAVAAMSYGRLRGYGLLADNPSILPGNAARDLAVVLAAIWLVVVVVVALRIERRRRAA